MLTGVGGVHDAQFPWSTWKKSGWFEAAVSVVSLSIRHMDRLIPGYRNFEQSLQSEYIGTALYLNIYSLVKFTKTPYSEPPGRYVIDKYRTLSYMLYSCMLRIAHIDVMLLVMPEL